MKIQKYPTHVDGCFLIKGDEFPDKRGVFRECYSEEAFRKNGLPVDWEQENASVSFSRVVRGLHHQEKNPQGKLITVFGGSIFDVCVDIRPESPTFRQWTGVHLSWERPTSLYIPPGCAHGFLVTSEAAMVHYKCTTGFQAEHAVDIHWLSAGIEWPLERDALVVMSEKDRTAQTLDDYLARSR